MDQVLTIYLVFIILMIRMSDQYNFVIEYPMFEYVDVSSDKSPVPRGGTSQF